MQVNTSAPKSVKLSARQCTLSILRASFSHATRIQNAAPSNRLPTLYLKLIRSAPKFPVLYLYPPLGRGPECSGTSGSRAGRSAHPREGGDPGGRYPSWTSPPSLADMPFAPITCYPTPGRSGENSAVLTEPPCNPVELLGE